MTSPGRARLARGSLDRNRILETALELTQEVGLANLNIPMLAARLDVGVTSIYWHVRNREELIRLMAARAIERLDGLLPSPDGWEPADWPSYLREYFTRQRNIFADDDLLTDLTVMRVTMYAPKVLNMGYLSIERLLRYLIAAGFAPVDGWNLYCALSLYTQGFAVVERRSRVTGFPRDPAVQIESLDVEKTPIIAGLLRAGAASIDLAGDPTFEAGLQWLLDGAAARASAGNAATAGANRARTGRSG
jgi:AcrR family transcriptional regulator